MIRIYDNFLFYADRVRTRALEAKFKTVEPAPGVIFRGIADVDKNNDWFANNVQQVLGVDIKVNYSFFRKSPVGQVEPAYIHSDSDMGHFTAILYLNYEHPEDDGTKFWKSKLTGSCIEQTPALPSPDLKDWQLIKHVPMLFNRAIIFDSRLYHSRSKPENFGTNDDSARLIQTIFFSV